MPWDEHELKYGSAPPPYGFRYDIIGTDREDVVEGETVQKVELKEEEFSGLVGNISGFRDKTGGVAGTVVSDLASHFLDKGGDKRHDRVFGLIDNILSGKGGVMGGGGGGPGSSDGFSRGDGERAKGFGGGLNLTDIRAAMDAIFSGESGRKSDRSEPSKGGGFLGEFGSLLVGGGGRGKYGGGGSNVKPNHLKGAVMKKVGKLIGKAAHRYLGVDPETGRIIGAIAGNVLMGLGGKDNTLGNVGKIVLDNIVSGKFKRKVKPFVRPEPRADSTGKPSSIQPIPSHDPLGFYAERSRCLAERRLFEDPHFPAEDRSLYFSRRPPKRVVWLRPGEIARYPQLFTEGHTRFDVIQGELGDCWLLAAVANLTLKDELFYRVVPPDQSFTENYAGIFHFQFWQYGKWVDVVIDDRLPTYNGELIYMHSQSNNEFWSALLEKAYAKLHGSYEALKGGTTSEALEDMTGGLTEFIDLRRPPANLMQMMMRGFEMGSLFGCSMEPDPRIFEARMSNGLVKGHAYSITGMRMVNGPYGMVCLMRIRNPWGNQQEWNGPWSDRSYEWRSIPDRVKEEMDLRFEHDGEFWMTFEDYMRNFEKMEICNLGPEVMSEIYEMTGIHEVPNSWATKTFDGAWIRNRTAGGCRNYISTFASNPQYRVRLIDPDPDDDDDLCTVIFAVMQKYRRNLKAAGLDNVPIGFAVYDAGDYSGRLPTEFFRTNRTVMRSALFINLREVLTFVSSILFIGPRREDAALGCGNTSWLWQPIRHLLSRTGNTHDWLR